jgi:hypothetical protein
MDLVGQPLALLLAHALDAQRGVHQESTCDRWHGAIARQPYEFGVKASIAVNYRSGLVVGARTFPGNPYGGHILSSALQYRQDPYEC